MNLFKFRKKMARIMMTPIVSCAHYFLFFYYVQENPCLWTLSSSTQFILCVFGLCLRRRKLFFASLARDLGGDIEDGFFSFVESSVNRGVGFIESWIAYIIVGVRNAYLEIFPCRFPFSIHDLFVFRHHIDAFLHIYA